MPTRAGAEGLANLLAAHLSELTTLHRSRSTWTHACTVLPALIAWLRERAVREASQVREEHLVGFLVHLAERRERPLSAASRAAYLRALQRFFAFLTRRGVLLVDPARELRTARWVQLPRAVLSEAEARRLVETPDEDTRIGQRDRALLETLYGTGLRQNECRQLDITDVELGQGLVLVRAGKGGRQRRVPLCGRALAAVAAYVRDARPYFARKQPSELALFLTARGTRVSRSLLDLVVSGHARRAGIARRISAHVLRHACATHLLRGGADVRHVQELLGHASLETTQIYTHVALRDLRAMVERFHPRHPRLRRGRRRG